MGKKAPDAIEGGWLVMKSGFEGIERPYDLLQELIQALGVSDPIPNGHSEKTEHGEIIATGRVGSKNAGYRWTENRDERSNAYIGCRAETFGLHAIQLEWSFTLSKTGYEYSFQHGRIRVRFASDDDQRAFALLWHAKAGHRPVLEPEGA